MVKYHGITTGKRSNGVRVNREQSKASKGASSLSGLGTRIRAKRALENDRSITSNAQIEDVGNFLCRLDLNSIPPHLKREGADWSALFNPNERRVLDIDLLHTLQHDSVVCTVDISHDGRLVATGCNHLATVYDVDTGAILDSFSHQPNDERGDLYVRGLSFSPDCKYLATGSEDGVVHVWAIGSAQIDNCEFLGHDADIYNLVFASNSDLIASCSGDCTLRVWSVKKREQVLLLKAEDDLTDVSFSPDGRFVAAASRRNRTYLWDLAGNLVHMFNGHKDFVYHVSFLPTGYKLITGSLDKTIKIWQLNGQLEENWQCIRTLEGHIVSQLVVLDS
jgi:general transcriptional corepressor TUP1